MAAAVALLSGCTLRTGEPAGEASSAAPSGDVVQRSLRDVERFWAATYPALADGATFQPVQGGFHPYTRTSPPPACGEEPAEYQPNAFYCPVGDFIAWDAEQLIPGLQAEFGPLLVGVVMAHEYGHAVQARLAVPDQPTVVLEQQADCFAGAWVADALAGRSTVFRNVTPDQLDSSVGGLLQLRDQPGTPALAPQAHGNAFDRVRAYQEGVEQGATRCAAYRVDNLPVTEVPFEDPQDEARIDCLAGTWANDLLTRDRSAQFRLSPGDPDEAVAALLAFARIEGGGTGVTAFERIASYREGVLNGLPGCA